MNDHITLLENDIASLKKPLEAEIIKPVEHFSNELIKIRTGRAHTSLIEGILVEVYGQTPMPLKGLAVLSAPDAKLLTIQPWDAGTIDAIEKAVFASNLGLTPISDGKVIRLTLPDMSSQRRDDLVKLLGKKLEECKIAIRIVRNKFHTAIKDSKKNNSISENFFYRLQDVLTQVTDDVIKKADLLAEKKKVEITSI